MQRCEHQWWSGFEDTDGFAVVVPFGESNPPGVKWVTRCQFCGKRFTKRDAD